MLLYSTWFLFPQLPGMPYSLDISVKNNQTMSVRNIGGTRVLVPGHQNSGAPTFFFRVFLMVYSHLCWQCSDKTRKCPEHINTLRKKEKLIFLKPILDIKTKTCWSSWKGTKVLVPPAFLAGLSWKKHAYKCWQCFNQTRKYQKHNSMFGKKSEFNISDTHF